MFFIFFPSCDKKTDSTIDYEEKYSVNEYPDPVPIDEDAVLVFVIQHSMWIPDNRITVQLKQDGERSCLYIDSQPMTDVPEFEDTQYHREKELSQKDFNCIQSLLEKINWKKLEKDDSFGVDGEIWSMNYKIGGFIRNVELFCPYDKSESDYKAFLDASKILLSYTGLDYNRLTDPEIYEPTINTKFPNQMN